MSTYLIIFMFCISSNNFAFNELERIFLNPLVSASSLYGDFVIPKYLKNEK